MSTLKENFTDLHEKFEKLKSAAKEIIEIKEQGKENEIDISKVTNDFTEVIQFINNISELSDKHSEISTRIILMKASLYYEQAKTLLISSLEKESEELLSDSLKFIKNLYTDPNVTFLYLRIVNHYSYLLAKREDLDTAKELLEEAEQVYATVKDQTIKIFNTEDLFIDNEKIELKSDYRIKLEKLVTNNLQMQGWIYNKQKQNEKFILYNHRVLCRQLETKDGSVLSWVMKTSKLASYFLSKNMFKEARHHLAASYEVLKDYENILQTYELNETTVFKINEIRYYYAEIAKSWVKYGLYLFNVSKSTTLQMFSNGRNRCLEFLWQTPFYNCFSELAKPKTDDKNDDSKTEDIPSEEKKSGKTEQVPSKIKSETDFQKSDSGDASTDTKNESPESILNFECGDANNIKNEKSCDGSYTSEKCHFTNYSDINLEFPSLNLQEIENQVTSDLIESTEQARALFVFIHSWLKQIKTFYNIRDYPIEYINTVLDLSELYRYLAFYEENIESQYNVQKRRADALETLSAVLKEIRPQCYLAIRIELLRELAEVQLDLMGLNLRRLYLTQKNAGHIEFGLHKMEALADIHARLELFSDTFGSNLPTSNYEQENEINDNEFCSTEKSLSTCDDESDDTEILIAEENNKPKSNESINTESENAESCIEISDEN